MFYTFAPAKSGPVSKQPKVRRACEYCRRQRVRCDNNVPCFRCVANHIHCTVPSATKQTRQSSIRPILRASANSGSTEAVRPNSVSDKDFEPTKPIATPPPPPPPAAPLIGEGQATRETILAPCSPLPSGGRFDSLTASELPPPKLPTPSYLGSITGFISRINSFCFSVSQMSTDASPIFSDAPPAYVSYTSPEVLAIQSGPCDNRSLSGLEQRLLNLYWTRLHWQMPIVSQSDLEQASSTRRAETLCNSMMAYCLQSLYHSGLHHRLLDLPMVSDLLDLEKGDKATGVAHRNSVLSISVNCFQRAFACSGSFAVYAHPSLSSVQSHIMIALFLLDAGEHQAAYNLLGLAIRIAQSLQLHHEPSSEIPTQEADLRRRVWWTLLHLDFQCSRYLGVEMTVKPRDTSCTIPSPPSTDPDAFHFHSSLLQLTRIAMAVTEALAKRQNELDEDDSAQSIEAYAEYLSQEVVHFHQWRDDILRMPQYRNLILVCDGDKPDSLNAMPSLADESSFYHQSPAQILQKMLLELQYHDVMIWVYRCYIQFPLRGLNAQRSTRADIHATTALKHALTAIDLVRFRMCRSDALYGCCQIYQYVWNAVLTLLGFTLAYPLCYWFPTAREHIALSLPIFDAAGADNPIASRAASLTRFLLKRVDGLVELLSSRQSKVPKYAVNMPSSVPMATHSTRAAASPIGSSITLDQPPLDTLWSLADNVNLDVWLSYCDEVSDVLMDHPDVSVGADPVYF